jgi:hypothetical protein
MPLIDEVNEKRREIRSDGYAMSISEWISLYEKKEVDIHPEFQRFYRWDNIQKTNLIESILLGIPIPPVFVSQRADGVWDVVDGLQRLSTIYQLIGVLRDESGELLEPLTLSGTKYLPSLEGKKWGAQNDIDLAIPSELRLIVKRAKINVSIILKESDENAKYDLFQRLNTGGSSLSPQEVRNCLLVMLDKTFYYWISELARFDPFQECIALSDRPLSEAYDIELVLRFIIFSRIEESELNILKDVGVFITEKMTEIASDQDFDRQTWRTLFENTFNLLAQEVSEDSFKRYNAQRSRFSGGFLLSQYEVVSCGIAWNLANQQRPIDVREKIISIWSDIRYTEWSGSGVTATRRLKRILPLGREIFES